MNRAPPGKTTNYRPGTRWRTSARVVLVLAMVLVGFESVLLVSRASRGRSDISVLIRSAALLNDGAGPEFYEGRDAVTGWSRAHPPATLALFQPLAAMGPTGAGVGWALANLAFLLLALWALRRFTATLGPETPHFAEAFTWLAALLLILAAGSIQVGQLSLLFVTCWILALDAFARGRPRPGGVALALPAVLKLYPALLLMAPTVLPFKALKKVLWSFMAGALAFTTLLPFLTMGRRVGPLTISWLSHSLFGEEGRVAGYLAGPGAVSTQSLVSIFSRFLTGGSVFHEQHPWVPHLDLDPILVLSLAGGITLALLSASIWATWRLRTSALPQPSMLLLSAAIWSATLYAVLPETKARYAVYTFLAFLPLVGWTHRAGLEGRRGPFLRGILLTGACLAAVIQALPKAIVVLGLGYLGSLALWGWNVRFALDESRRARSAADGVSDPFRGSAPPASRKGPDAVTGFDVPHSAGEP